MRQLDWDGCPNVRDLGELPTPLAVGGRTIPGRIARGPRRELLTKQGWQAALDWGLRSVVDLRSAREVGGRAGDPNVAPPGNVVVTLAPTEDQEDPEFRRVCMPILDSPEYWMHNVRILPNHLRATLEAIANARAGVLVHCAAGRDRTGMISALLLSNAGVRADDIVADYEASVHAMAGTAPHSGPVHDRQARWDADRVCSWLAEVRRHVLAFVADPEAVFSAIGISRVTKQRLRDQLTER